MVQCITNPEERETIAAHVLAALTDWFGLPESTAEYIRRSREMSFWAETTEKGEIRGFIALRETSPWTGEIYVMGVLPRYHRQGVGRALFQVLCAEARRCGYEFLQVKTVQEGCYPEYDRTNAFYRSLGFRELECFPNLWDAWNPCQVFVMALR